jgi:hypothetical protein
MRIALSGDAGIEETDGVVGGGMDGVLVLLCGELVGTMVGWDADVEPVVSQKQQREPYDVHLLFAHIFSPFRLLRNIFVYTLSSQHL